jgi:amphi-Trp domain-containing protein
MKANKISHHQRMKREDLVCCLEDLTESIRTGKIVIERNGQFVSLTPPDTLSVELAAKMKKDKGELSIEISWKKPSEEPASPPLIISSDEPEILLSDAMEDDGSDDQDDMEDAGAGDDNDLDLDDARGTAE